MGNRNNPQAEEKAAFLLKSWRKTRRPVVHIQHLSQTENSPLREGSPGSDIKEIVKPENEEPVFQK